MSDDATPKRTGLPIAGQPSSPQPSEADRQFLEQEREISTPEFLQAVLEDQREEVAKMIVADDRLVRSRDIAGATAVQLAVYHGLDEMLGVLVRSGVDLDLWESAAIGDAERVAVWIDAEESLLDETSQDGFTALALAAYYGRREVLDLLLARGADPNRVADNPTRVQPLHAAAAHRDSDASQHAVGALLAAGADPDVEQAGGFRPLHNAAGRGDLAVVELLLAHHADPTAASDLGLTPAALAAERGHDAVAERLRQRPS
ncbi:MAG: ankyrin repeat domain-containing protein [Acidobacteriota bacterium]